MSRRGLLGKSSLFLLGVWLVHSLCLSASARAPGNKKDFLQQELTTKKKHLRTGQDALSRLEQREDRLYLRLQRIEQEIDVFSRELKAKEDVHFFLREEKQDLEDQIKAYGEQTAFLRQQVADLLQKFWLLYLQKETGMALDFSSLDEVRVYFVWFSQLVQEVKARLVSLQQRSTEMSELLKRKIQQEQALAADLQEIKSKYEELLDKKLEYIQAVRQVRAQKLVKEEELARIRKVVQGLECQIKVLSAHQFKKLKGYLPWPAKGEVISRYALHGGTQKQGIGLRLSASREVRVISWGKVVFNDKLRGFGQVVIVYHGQHYYSLYAFLQETRVRIGQNLEQGEPIGLAGYYPLAKGPGLYFELRKGKQSLDPLPWLRELHI